MRIDSLFRTSRKQSARSNLKLPVSYLSIGWLIKLLVKKEVSQLTTDVKVEEAKALTFKPEINANSNRMVSNREKCPIYDRLIKETKNKSTKLMQKAEEIYGEMAFVPKINHAEVSSSFSERNKALFDRRMDRAR